MVIYQDVSDPVLTHSTLKDAPITPAADDDDDGLRKVAASEGLQWAITDHLRDTGKRMPGTFGGRLAIGVAKGKPSANAQVEEWRVNYDPPSGADAVNAAAAASPAPAASVDPLAGLI